MASEATLKMLLLGVDRGASRMLRGAGNEAQRTTGKFGKLAKAGAIGLAAGLAAAGAAAVKFGRDSVNAYKDAASESLMLGRTAGLTLRQASRLRFSAQQTGVDFKVLATSTKLLTKNLAAASTDGKKMAAVNKSLGFSIKNASGQLKPMNELLPQIADRFKEMPDGPQKTALALKLFGKSGADMVKLLNKGSEGMKKFGEESDRTGNTLSNTDALKKQLKAQREFSATISGLKIQLGAALLPVLAEISKQISTNLGPAFTKMIPSIKEFGKWIQEKVIPVVRELAGKYMAGLAEGFENLKPHLKELKPLLSALGSFMVNVLVPVMGKLYSVVLPALGTALGFVAEAIGAVGRAGKAMWNNVLQPVFRFLANAIGSVLTGISKMLSALGHVPGFGWAKDAAKSMKEAAAAAHAIANNINKIPSEVKVRFSFLISPRDQSLLTNGPKVTSLVYGDKGGRAVGGRINTPGVYRTGELGTEDIYLPRNAYVQSNMAGQRAAAQMGTGSTPPPITININGVGFDKRHAAREIVGILKEAGVTTGIAVMP